MLFSMWQNTHRENTWKKGISILTLQMYNQILKNEDGTQNIRHCSQIRL